MRDAPPPVRIRKAAVKTGSAARGGGGGGCMERQGKDTTTTPVDEVPHQHHEKNAAEGEEPIRFLALKAVRPKVEVAGAAKLTLDARIVGWQTFGQVGAALPDRYLSLQRVGPCASTVKAAVVCGRPGQVWLQRLSS